MAKRRSTYGKLDRERAKKAKAAAKRQRRHARPEDAEHDAESEAESEPQSSTPGPAIEEPGILARLAHVHERYDAGEITFREFEEQKTALVSLLDVD